MIGGIAATLHGSRFVTEDVDVLVAANEPSLTRLANLLQELDTKDSRRRSIDRVIADLRDGGSARLRTSLGALDVMTEIPAEGDFSLAALRQRGERLRMGRRVIHVASLDDIIAMKEQAHRVKDLARLPELRRIRELTKR